MTDSNRSRRGNHGRLHAVGNPVARSPLLRKGGVHKKNTSGKRQRARLSTSDAIEEWLEMRDDEMSEACEIGSSGSLYFE
jgi:hypothetical protein